MAVATRNGRQRLPPVVSLPISWQDGFDGQGRLNCRVFPNQSKISTVAAIAGVNCIVPQGRVHIVTALGRKKIIGGFAKHANSERVFMYRVKTH